MKVKPTAVAALIGGALALTSTSAIALPLPVRPAAPIAADPAKKSVEERLGDIERQLADVGEILKGRKDEKGYPLPSDPGLVDEVKRLRNQVDALKSQIEGIKSTTALKPNVGATATAGKGVVRIVNDYPVEITIVVNNENSYRVAAGKTREVSVDSGEFSYFLLSSGIAGAPTKSAIKDKEIVTLRIK